MRAPFTRTSGFCLLIAAGAAVPATGQPVRPRLEEKAGEQPEDKAKAYRILFERVGQSGLSGLTKDKDTGLALQASWEQHKKLVKRTTKLNPNDSAHTYDAAGVKKFLDFLKARTKAPVPDWWETAIVDLSVDEGRSSGYFRTDPDRKELVKIKVGERMWYVKKGAEMTISGGTWTYRSGGVALEVPAPKRFGDLLAGDCVSDASGGKTTCLAAYTSASAHRFKMAGFESKTGKRVWDAWVWGHAKQDYAGPSTGHRAELVAKGETAFVFGEEACGVYLEAFDLSTGACRFRFCTSYWMHFSEGWNLNPRD